MTWLGNAGFSFNYSHARLIRNPYFTRAGAARLVSRAHFDHCLHAPDLARIDGSRLYGLANICTIRAYQSTPPENWLKACSRPRAWR